MGGERGVAGTVGQHGVQRGRERFGTDEAGEDRLVPDLVGENEGGTLVNSMGVEFLRGRRNAGAHLGGVGPGVQGPRRQAGGPGGHCNRLSDPAETASFAEGGVRKGEFKISCN